MKKPEEIKKGLRQCADSEPYKDCPYDGRDFPYCTQRMSIDAREYIEQLEEQNRKLQLRICDYSADIAAQNREIELLKRERDNMENIEKVEKALDRMAGHDVDLICRTNGAPCCECKPGSPCAIRRANNGSD